MSLNLWLPCCTCNQELRSLDVTYNLGPMWRAAAQLNDGRLIEIDGMTAEVAATFVAPALTRLLADPVHFRTLNPENGWGSYEGLVETLRLVADAGSKWPDAKWKAHR